MVDIHVLGDRRGDGVSADGHCPTRSRFAVDTKAHSGFSVADIREQSNPGEVEDRGEVAQNQSFYLEYSGRAACRLEGLKEVAYVLLLGH
jgi:hypothetical protein